MDQAESTTHPGGVDTLLLLLFPLHSSLMRPLPDGVLFMLLQHVQQLFEAILYKGTF